MPLIRTSMSGYMLLKTPIMFLDVSTNGGPRSGTTTWCGDPTIRTTRASGRTTEQSLRNVFGSVSADKHRILIDNPARCVGFDVEALRAGVARHVRECLVQRHPRLGG